MILYNFYGLAGLITFLSYTAVKRGVEQNCDITYFTNFLLHYRLNFNPYEKAFFSPCMYAKRFESEYKSASESRNICDDKNALCLPYDL